MRVFENDEMRLDRIDEGKRMIDLKVSDNDSANAWLANVALKQLFNLAQRRADASPSGHLQRRVQFVLDEFPNVGRIPDFERSIATVRSRGISFLMCAQSLSQLDVVYGKSTSLTILDNCDSLVYMGGGSRHRDAELHKRTVWRVGFGHQVRGRRAHCRRCARLRDDPRRGWAYAPHPLPGQGDRHASLPRQEVLLRRSSQCCQVAEGLALELCVPHLACIVARLPLVVSRAVQFLPPYRFRLEGNCHARYVS